MNFRAGFTRLQHTLYMRAEKIIKYLRNHQPLVDTFLPLQAKQPQLESKISALDLPVGTKSEDTLGNTTEKNNAKKAVSTHYKRACSLARSFCIDTNNAQMAANLRITKTQLMRLPDGEVLSIVLQINKWIGSLLPDPAFAQYGITASTLSDGLALARHFDSYVGSTANIKAARSVAGKEIKTLFKKIKNDIERIEMHMDHFVLTNAQFYNGFHAAKKLDNLGIRHNILHGKATLDGQPLGCGDTLCQGYQKTQNCHHQSPWRIQSARTPRWRLPIHMHRPRSRATDPNLDY
jgi:hypothetical protein